MIRRATKVLDFSGRGDTVLTRREERPMKRHQTVVWLKAL